MTAAKARERLTMKMSVPHSGQTAGGSDRFGEYNKDAPVNVTGYVKPATMEEWRAAGDGRSVVGIAVTVSPVYEGEGG